MKLAKMIFSVIGATMLTISAFAQTNVAKGSVYGDDGQPLIGASIIVKGTTNGTITNADGTFSLNNIGKGTTLVIESLGYTSQEVVFNGSAINVTLSTDTELLEQVVVVGYGIQKKSDLTGSISSVKADALENRSVADLTSAISGKVAGIQVLNTSGMPGTFGQIRLRGLSSNNADATKPLYIVDGILIESLDNIDPADIESLEVLKDGASAAIYGAQAGNGVVLVTTKKGIKGHSRVTYDGSYTFERAGDTPKMMNSTQYVETMIASTYTDKNLIDAAWNGKTDTDWVKELYTGGATKKHKISFEGANDKGSFYLSLSNLDSDGMLISDLDFYKRMNVQANAEYKIKDWLTVGTNNTFTRSKQTIYWNIGGLTAGSYDQGQSFYRLLTYDPITPAWYTSYDEMPSSFKDLYDAGKPMMMIGDKYVSLSQLKTTNRHPLDRLFPMKDNYVQTNNLTGNVYLNFNPIKGLVFTSKVGYSVYSKDAEMIALTYYYPGFNNETTTGNTTLTLGLNYQWDNYLNYSTTIAKKHNISAMAGSSFVRETSNYLNIASPTEGFSNNSDSRFWYPSYYANKNLQTVYGSPEKYTSISYFARLGYNYDERYYIQGSFRADAFDTSYLPANKRWGYFPSVSLGWNVMNEPFMSGVDKSTLSFLKVRGSWGTNGNVSILKGSYAYTALVAVGSYYKCLMDPYSATFSPVAMLTDMVNPNLTWETSKQFDFGVDARFFSDRLSATLDYYHKTTDGLLVENPMPATTGYSSLVCNSGIVINQGVEIELSWKDKVGDFSYGVSGNIAHNSNKVDYLDPGVPYINGATSGGNYVTRMSVGDPLWYFYGYRYAGVDTESGRSLYYNAAGETIFGADLTEADKTKIGSSDPLFTYGLTLNAEYKGFDLTVFGTGSVGNDIWFGLIYKDNNLANMPVYIYNNMWKKAGDSTKYPSYYDMHQGKFIQSDACVMDGSYFRIAQMQLGYTLPEKIMSKVKVSALRFYASFDNMFTFTSYKGCDPATATCNYGAGQGIDHATYPSAKRIMLGVNLSF